MNLHMHDLRRETGSRLLERGADLHTVQRFLIESFGSVRLEEP